MTRRQILLGMPAFLQKRPQRVIVLMVDGLGPDYIAALLKGYKDRAPWS